MNRKTVIFFLSAILMSGILQISCSHEKRNAKREYAATLYYRSVSMLKIYTDSMMAARDSSDLLGLAERLNNQLAVLNFECPSDTDLEITEGENDTLTMLTDKIVMLRDSMLFRFAHPETPGDSVPTDSLSVKMPQDVMTSTNN